MCEPLLYFASLGPLHPAFGGLWPPIISISHNWGEAWFHRLGRRSQFEIKLEILEKSTFLVAINW